jgi:hypothetical protein
MLSGSYYPPFACSWGARHSTAVRAGINARVDETYEEA